MRSFSHWNIKYIKNRISTLYYEKTCPKHPWLTRSSNEFIDAYLLKSDTGLEFGSGRSTIWFAQRLKSLISIEHQEEWAYKVEAMLKENNINNVDYRIIPNTIEDEAIKVSEYIKVIDELDDNSLDFCLIDGIYRDFCASDVINKIRPGGMLVIDNANLYLPSESQTINSLSFNDGAKSETWEKVLDQLKIWRIIWTCSGVTDTAIFIKPCTE